MSQPEPHSEPPPDPASGLLPEGADRGGGRRFRSCRAAWARAGVRIGVVAGVGAALLAVSPGAARDPGPGIRWGGCPRPAVPEGMRCGTVDVPLDYARPHRGAVRVAVARLPATGSPDRRLGPLLLNFGGPGGSGLDGLAGGAAALAGLRERYDLVAFDPRGVGHSEPVSCGGSQETGPAAGADAAARLAALRAVARRCELASGPVLAHMGTVDVAHDMDRIRQALGASRLDYLGFSYGTRLGAVYAARFPRTAGRMVLDGVDTLTAPLAERARATAHGRQRALEAFLAWCAGREGCPYDTGGDPADALVARLDAEPLVGRDGSYFTARDAVASLAAGLSARRTWPALAAALALLEREGDPGGLLRLSRPAESEPAGPGGTPPVPADNAEAALTAVSCADDPDRSRDRAAPQAVAEETDRLGEDLRRASEVFGPQQLAAVLACHGRPAGSDFLRRIDHPAGAPRMLLVGSRRDPVTPYHWTQETARRLGGPAAVLDHRGDGPAGYPTSRCVREHVHRFLFDGRLPAPNSSCPAGS